MPPPASKPGLVSRRRTTVPTLAFAIAPARSGAVTRTAYAVACTVTGAVFVAVLAQVSVQLPFTPVPITGQTLGVLLVGAAYGPALGAATLGLYLLWGVAGLPVFAPNPDGSYETGLAVLSLAGATGGYLWGFVLSAWVGGRLARRGWDRSLRGAAAAMRLGEGAIYAVGLPWLHQALPRLVGGPVSVGETLRAGLYPFVVG
ncbi:MAG: biotin transporter BioY, partial [Actinobacteria bacterium]|nr:biotin transporter BioY [Actinomycetota bacterium]